MSKGRVPRAPKTELKPKNGRVGKQDVVPGLMLATNQTQSTGQPIVATRHGSMGSGLSGPPGTVQYSTGDRGGLLTGFTDRTAPANPMGVGAPRAGGGLDGLLPLSGSRSDGRYMASGFRCSGVPVPQPSEMSSVTQGNTSHRGGKNKKSRRSLSSDKSAHGKRCKGEDLMTRADLFQAFQSFTTSLTGLPAPRQMPVGFGPPI